MRNRVISYSLSVSKATRDNYHVIWWKYCFMSKIYRYIWISGVTEEGTYMVHRTFIFCLLLIKTEKIQEHDLYSNQILHHFDLQTFFLGWIIKILRNGVPRGPAPIPISLRSEYSSSNWFHSNTSNSRHLFNTNS